jgi:hypothetical protein
VSREHPTEGHSRSSAETPKQPQASSFHPVRRPSGDALVRSARAPICEHTTTQVAQIKNTRSGGCDAGHPERPSEGCAAAKLADALGDQWVLRGGDEQAATGLYMQSLARSLRTALARVKVAQRALADALKKEGISALITGIKGIGVSLAAAITIGLHGNDGRRREQLALRLGASPVTTRSGKTGDARPGVHMRRAAAPTMRRASYLMGWQLTGNHRWAKAQYAACRARGISAAGAYRRITRSFSRILPALIKNNTPFDEERYILALKRRGVAWAMPL